MRATWIIDDRGELWPADSQSLSDYLGTDQSGPHLTSFVVRNLGFIAIQLGARVNEIVYSPAAVAPEALAGVLYWLSDNAFVPVALREMKQTGAVPVHLHKRGVIQAIGKLIDARQFATEFSLSDIPISRSPFARTWEAAREICCRLSSHTDRDGILEHLFEGRFAVGRQDSGDGEFKVTAIGSYVSMRDDEFAQNAKGRSFRHLYDNSYGHWIADTYRTAVALETPTAARIDATITWPRLNPRKYRYSRLLMPFMASTGERYLMSASVEF
jgi:hypothetical protein